MEIHADFSKVVALDTAKLDWVPSPMKGVDRRMLDRIGDEVARATSIVRYAPGSEFPEHTHSGGEEFIVLDGVFQDEHGDYPAGTYVRNPIGTHHVPRSEPGCTIFVKLWQFAPDDTKQFSVDLGALEFGDPRDGVASTVIHSVPGETVAAELWDVGAMQSVSDPDGVEILVLDGSLQSSEGKLRKHDWLRLPRGASTELTAGPDGAFVWRKSGHLGSITIPR